MVHFFQEITSFVDVPKTEEGVDTDKFLEAAKGIVLLCERLSKVKLALVTADMNTNIGKIQTVRKDKYASLPSVTLHRIVSGEISTQPKGKLGTATDALLWLTRGLIFMYLALDKVMKDKNKELNTAFNEAYDASLKEKHAWLVQKSIKFVLGQVPSRSELFVVLKKDERPQNLPADQVYTAQADASQGEVEAQIAPWLAALDSINKDVEKMYVNKGLEKVYGK